MSVGSRVALHAIPPHGLADRLPPGVIAALPGLEVAALTAAA